MGNFARLAFVIGTAALLADCGGSQPPIGAPNAMAQGSGIAAPAGSRPQSCNPYHYAECITLKWHPPFEQELCVDYGYLYFGPSCVPSGSKPWNWLLYHLKGHGRFRHVASKKIKVSFYPNPGNPTEVTISERERIGSSRGKVAFSVALEACIPITGGEWCTPLRRIGVVTE